MRDPPGGSLGAQDLDRYRRYRSIGVQAETSRTAARHTGQKTGGIRFERRMFHATFATEDQKEGMAAFAEKRKAEWKHR